MPPSFADLGVPAPLCATLARRGIHEPFPIQAATLPDVLAGRDVAGKAPTGSGKTLAFGLGIARQAADAGRLVPRRPRALVLVPTRELAAQVQRELSALIDERAHGAVVSIYGGVGYGPQRKALARGVSAVVACPGRLEDLVASGDVVLDRAELVVLDEADRMADMGFMPAVRRLLDVTPEVRQTLLFSATLDGDVDKLVRNYQRDPVHHEVAGLGDDDGAAVEHLFWSVPRDKRVPLTGDIVARTGPTIVFTRTRHGADRVAKQLGRSGVKAVAIHGRRSQAQRDQALKQFRTGRAPALVATDVAARGIHVDGVACVVHFDLPDDSKDYVHRSGRTGRAGAEGIVVALVPEDGQRAARTLQREVDRKGPIEEPDLDRLGDRDVRAEALASVSPVATPESAPVAVGPQPGPAPERADRSGHARSGGATGRRDGARPGRRERAHLAGRSDRDDRSAGSAGGTRHGRRARDAERDGDGGAERRDRGAGRARGDRGVARDHGAGRDRSGRRDREAGRVSGTVASYNPARGFGFISRRGGADVFVHVSALSGSDQTLEPGQRVRFELAPGRRGQQATNVRPVS